MFQAIRANYRTTFTGIGAAIIGFLSLLAMAPSELGDVSLYIPTDLKAKIFIYGAVASMILKALNSAYQKDSAVSGNGSATRPFITPPTAPPSTVPLMLWLALLITATAFTFAACETVNGHKQLTPAAKATLTSLASDVGTVFNGALAGALTGATSDAASQGMNALANGGQFDTKELEAAAITNGASGAVLALRQLQQAKGQPTLTAPVIQAAIAQNTGSPAVTAAIAPGIAQAVVTAVNRGTPPNVALETAAKSLDTQIAPALPFAASVTN